MKLFKCVALVVFLFALSVAQGLGQMELKIDSTNRTIAVSGSGNVSVEPEVAILHVGFQTGPGDAKSAYAQGSQTSNAIVSALKQAGVAEGEIRSESQYLAPDYSIPKQHKYKLTQQWTVRCAPARAAELLDTAVDAGANSSGEIEWNVKDEKALERQALDKAAMQARENGATIAKAMGVSLGKLLYVTNQSLFSGAPTPIVRSFALKSQAQNAPLAVAPEKVTRDANVQAIFAIE